jgi:class 3 adenylate cyclase
LETAQRAILFADVCESTALYESLGDTKALGLVNQLFALLNEKVAADGGTVVKTLGDGMVCQFRDSDAAFRAACDMQVATTGLAPEAQHKLAIKIGFTYGQVVLSAGDVFGDTVNVCSRLVGLANPSQVLTTQLTVDALSPGLRTRCRQLYPLKVKGRAEEVTVCEVMWRIDPDVTEMSLTRGQLVRARAGHWVLKLTYQGETYTVEPNAAIRLGRDKENDIVIASHLASRVHARIFGREGHFVLADQSSNGTFLLADNAAEVLLRREEAMLGERGWIGLGSPAGRHGDHVVRYRLERRGAG